MLSVPIMWTLPHGGMEPLGVVNLSDRYSGPAVQRGRPEADRGDRDADRHGDSEHATRARVARASSGSIQELALAHDLQMKLLPRTEIVAPEAQVAARVVPAESVGGDFYNLFRLSPSRTGIMIGDVSSHGYRAALIMALAMSASAIHAQASPDPDAVLASLEGTLREELVTTEMFITGVLRRDRPQREDAALREHGASACVSRRRSNGTVERLPAIDPPIGMVETLPHARSRPGRRNGDLLVLFTDGVSDARNRFGVRLGEQPVLDIVQRYRTETPAAIVQRVFEELAEHTGEAVQRDDLAVVIARS